MLGFVAAFALACASHPAGQRLRHAADRLEFFLLAGSYLERGQAEDSAQELRLKGLRFGMTRAEAAGVLPEVIGAEVLAPTFVQYRFMSSSFSLSADAQADDSAGLVFGTGPELAVPGSRISVRTTVVGLPASCTLDFAVSDPREHASRTLSKMTCELDPFPEAPTHMAVEEAIVALLVDRVGPSDSNDVSSPGCWRDCKRKASWAWHDETATLQLSSELETSRNDGAGWGSVTASKIRVVSTSRAHEDLMRRLEDASMQYLKREQMEAAAKRRDAIRNARDALTIDGADL